MEKKDFSSFRSKEIGFIFQLHNLIPNLTASENVQIPMLQTDSSDEEMVTRASELLKSVDQGIEWIKFQQNSPVVNGRE